jgi:iron complex transport system substrate-binding protein
MTPARGRDVNISPKDTKDTKGSLCSFLSVLCALCVFVADVAAGGGAKPSRVASLNLAADEVLAEILPAGRLVGVTALVDEQGTSNALGRVPASVPRFPKADLERLLAVQPDLVIVSEYTDADFLTLLERSGVRHHRMRGLGSLAGIRQAVLDLGDAVGERAAADRLIARYDATLAALEARLRGAPRPRVLYWAGGLTAGSGTAIGSLIACGGGANLGAELGLSGIAPVGAERAYAASPDRVLVGEGWQSLESLRKHPLLSQLAAVREGRVLAMPTELLVALNHHSADACWDLAHRLHPDRVPATRP